MPVRINITQLQVRSLDVDFHEVTWEVERTIEDVLDYQFQVLRSESPEGPFDKLTEPFEDKYNFIDNIKQNLHRWRSYFYSIRVIHKQSGDTKDFGPALANEPEPDRIAMELRRHIRLLMNEWIGRRCVILPVRTFGQRCPDCWNEVLQKVSKSGCSTCFGTGYARGFLHPIEAWISIDPSAKTEQNLNVGKTQQDNTTLRMGYYPPVKPYDVIMEPDNKRWRVVQQSQTEHVRSPVHQEIQVHRINEGDVEFAIPVDYGGALKNQFFSPPRNQTQPTSLQTFEDEEIPMIFQLYHDMHHPHGSG